MEKVVLDTSAIIEGILSEKIENKEIQVDEVIIHEAVLAELEHQANQGKAIGYIGLDELEKLRELKVSLKFSGRRPSAIEIKHASLGEIDSLIRELAWEEGAVLISGDKTQTKLAEIKGINTMYVSMEKDRKGLELNRFFDDETMSVHLREGMFPLAKKGKPGEWKLVELEKKQLGHNYLNEVSKEIIERAKIRKDSFIEIQREGSTIVQLGKFRTVITRPPFSDGLEITAVRPIKKLELEDYKLSEKLMKRIADQAEGIIVAGSPGEGKCLDGEEIIYDRNFKPIKVKDFFERDDKVLYSVNEDGKFVKDTVINKSRRKEKILYDVRTRTGREIRVTEEHPLLLFRDKLRWFAAKDLKVKDKIGVIRHINNGTNDQLDFLQYYNPKTTLCRLIPINKEIPIFYKYLHTNRKILYYIYSKGSAKKEEISHYIECSIKHTRTLLKKLIEDGIIFQKDKIYFIKKEKFNLKNYNFLSLQDMDELGMNRDHITHIEVISNKYKNKYNFIKIPKKINQDLCKFLGYILSEGGGDKISFTNTNQTLINDFKKVAHNTFGIESWKKLDNAYYIDWKTSIQPFLENSGFLISKKKKSRNMHLPDFLYNCSSKNLRSFLEAYFDGDGSVSKRRSIEFYTSSEETADQLVRLLLRLNVYSHINKKFQKGADRFTVKIFDIKSIRNFVERIKPLSKDKAEKLRGCINKKYSQTIVYDIHPLINNIKKHLKLKIKPSISVDRMNKVLEEMYKIYYKYSSKNEKILSLLKEYIERIEKMQGFFDKNKEKLTYSVLRENNMDHNCIQHWNKNRKIKISTINKIMNILGYNIKVSPKVISNLLLTSLQISKLSIAQVSESIGREGGTTQLRLQTQWDTDIEGLKRIHEEIFLHVTNTKREMESVIKNLEILGDSDLLFDEIVEINKIEGDFEVYDFETKNHNFICGKIPLMVHNSTFASALAEFYASQNKIVKTLEAPRDLQLKENITQYALSHAEKDEIYDIMLLSRPDYTVFDEMRDTEDFKLYVDLRLAGIGLMAVVHATNPIDTIQRFIGRTELGVIPQVIDTVVFIRKGFVHKILSLKMVVKVPSGMMEADLARPVVEVRDFENGKLEFEIYSYGEETVVIPIQEEGKSGVKKLAERQIENSLRKISDIRAEVIGDNKAIIYVPKEDIARIIGKQGKNIEILEKKLGLSIDVQEAEKVKDRKIDYDVSETGKFVTFYVKEIGGDVDVFVNRQFLFSAKASKKGEIRVHKKSKLGHTLVEALDKGKIEIKAGE